jgi:hypothetical protein
MKNIIIINRFINEASKIIWHLSCLGEINTNALNALTQIHFPLPSRERARVRGDQSSQRFIHPHPTPLPSRERGPM